MYELLRSLPLFHGVGDERISELVERIPFHFLKFEPGAVINNAGERCQYMRFVVSGCVHLTTECKNLRVKLLQTLSAPEVLGPDSLFGVDNCYPFTAVAGERCGILQLRKSDYMKVLQTDKLFLFNILNYLSRNCQRRTRALQGIKTGSIAERFAREITDLTTQHSTDIKLQFCQKDLCTLMGVQRSTLIAGLDQMVADGLIDYTSTEINIKSLRSLQDVLG